MKEQLEQVISYSQDLSLNHVNVDVLLEKWRVAKSKWIDRFGGNPIYEVGECTLSLDEEERKSRWNSFAEFWCRQMENRSFWDAAEFFWGQGADAFFKNEVVKNNYGISVGAKLLRAMKSLISDEAFLKDFQNEASMLIQENSVSGTLCLSVHPLDYLSLSENTYNWRSCHALDGEYRAGNLSYITDTSSIICYLKGRDEVILPNFPASVPWNSKKWRMLLFESESGEILAAGRQYPFFSYSALEKVTDALVEVGKIQSPKNWTKWRNETISEEAFRFQDGTMVHPRAEYYNINGLLVERMRGFMENVEGALNYNDLLYSSCYRPYLSFHWASSAAYKDGNFFKIGSKAPCVCCGQHDTFISNSMLCKECEIKYGHVDSDAISYCSVCGERFLTEQGVYVESSNQFVCPDCYNNEFSACKQCEEVIPNRSLSEGLCWHCRHDPSRRPHRLAPNDPPLEFSSRRSDTIVNIPTEWRTEDSPVATTVADRRNEVLNEIREPITARWDGEGFPF